MCNRDARMLLSVIKFGAIQLSISGDLTKNFGRHNWFRATQLRARWLSGDLTRRRKGLSAWIASSLWSHSNPDFWTSQSCFLSSNWFFNASIHLLIKLLVITEPAVPSAWLLGLDWKLYPSNMQLSIHVVFLEYTNINRASERKALLAGWNYLFRLVESIFHHTLNWVRTTVTIQSIIENTQAGRWNFKCIKN